MTVVDQVDAFIFVKNIDVHMVITEKSTLLYDVEWFVVGVPTVCVSLLVFMDWVLLNKNVILLRR